MTEEDQGTEEAPETPEGDSGEGTPEAPEATPQSDGDDWRAPIQDEGARKFADSFSSPAAAAEAAHKFRQQLSTAIVVPGEDADDEAKAEFRKKMGVPEKATGYEITPPDSLPEELQEQVFTSEAGVAALDRYRAVAHEHNMSPTALQALVDENIAQFVEAQGAADKEREAGVENANNALKTEWGKDFETNENFGKEAIKTFDADGSLVKLLEGATADGIQLGDHPAFRKAFANIGRSMGEDGFHVTPSEGESQDIKGRLAELMGLMDTDMPKYQSAPVQNEIQKLNTKLAGDAPIVGSQGVAA